MIITGINGFKGQNTIEYFSKEDILCASSKPKSNQISYLDFSKQNINGKKNLIHLAGYAHDLKNTASSQE